MIKTAISILIITLLTGCALSSANHQSAGDGQYIVRASGNAKDTKTTLLKTISKRAEKLCGPNYKFLNDTAVVESSFYSAYGPVPVRSLSRHVMCEK